ncbi:hypothetical protein ASPZODRAFT_11599 [Penicilliopsis zonata CBS 506.65]|uniref:TMEM205-like domain-containing protein n=1 Tax=Penicilliopsis zonata CBS 506.65 TaxID=1073090 RepID=A0A1L9SUE5_9EURO|nr:hypothetical protein ASPZODRAFT_11599 [Penicilliopsis zonata CBS 506.65]OJJ50744.1 hypothetical protein ASPZODRAFT_11599 [Penicilliopsis zonata CBS 506.65]
MLLQCSHLLSYGSLLGIQVFQTCVNGIVAFHSLPRPYFSVLQTAIFPVYFSLQAFLPLAVVATSLGFNKGQLLSSKSMAVVFGAGLLNLLVFRPLTYKVITEKKRQEIRDKRKSYDPPPHSPAMVALNRRFVWIHTTSILINLGGLLATMEYGIALSKRLS